MQGPCVLVRSKSLCAHSKSFCVYVLSCLSHVPLFVILWTLACQAPLSMVDFPDKDTGVGFYALPRGLSWPRDWTRVSLSPALAGRFFATSATWEANLIPITNFYLRFILFIYLNKVIKAIQKFSPRMFVCVCVCVCVYICVWWGIYVCVWKRDWGLVTGWKQTQKIL